MKKAAYKISEFKILQAASEKMIPVTVDELVAINTAIMLLNNSASDHADQCLHYLAGLRKKMIKVCNSEKK